MFVELLRDEYSGLVKGAELQIDGYYLTSLNGTVAICVDRFGYFHDIPVRDLQAKSAVDRKKACRPPQLDD